MDTIGEQRGYERPDTASADAEPVVSVRGLVKSYGSHEAVRASIWACGAGEIFAFLGPERRREDHDGRDPRGVPATARRRGHRPGRGSPARRRGWRTRSASCSRSPSRSGTSPLPSVSSSTPATTRAPRDVDETLALVGLADQADAAATRLSGGQRRRLDVALALIGDPELLFLDEPTTGFDPPARRAAWEMIAGLRAARRDRVPHDPLHGGGRAPRRPGGGVATRAASSPRAPPGTLGGREHAPPRSASRLPAGTVPTSCPTAVHAGLADQDGARVLIARGARSRVLGPLSRWAEDRDVDLARPRSAPPEPRGRLPLAHRPASSGDR